MHSRTLLVGLLTVASVAARAHDFVFDAVYVPLAQGADGNRPFDINDAGQVVGETYTAEGPRGFVWQESEGVRLLSGPANEPAFAVAVNQTGVIVGAYLAQTGYRPCLWTGSSLGRDLGLPDQATRGLPVGISDDGTVFGNFEVLGGFLRPFRWTESKGVEALPVNPLLGFDQLMGVGPGGKALGFGLRRATLTGIAGPFFISESSYTTLTAPPVFSQLVPKSMNEHGEIVGWAIANGTGTPCVWHEDGELHTLTLPTGYETGLALDINSEDVVVGRTESPSVAWISGHHGILNLNLLAFPGGPLPPLVGALAVNDDGFVLAQGPSLEGVILIPKTVEWTESHIVSMSRGKLVDGDESALRTYDVESAVFEGGPTSARFSPGVEFVLEGTTSFAHPNRLVFRSVARQDWGDHARLVVEPWDWEAGKYDSMNRIDAYVPAPRLGLHELTLTGDLSRYVQPGTRRLRARVRLSPHRDLWKWQVEFDQLTWFAG